MNDAGRIGFLIKGNYDSEATYDFLDVVFWEGASYVAKKLTVGHAPADNNEYWQVLACIPPSVVSNEYMEEHFVPDYVSSAFSNVSTGGWYRIAENEVAQSSSCTISMKRRWNSPGPEYQKVQLVSSYDNYKFVNIAALSNTHMWVKIRLTKDNTTSRYYIEAFQDRDSNENYWYISVEDAIGAYGKWKAITATPTEESADGVTVLASLDLPENFDITHLLNKAGDIITGIQKLTGTGTFRFIAPSTAEWARGMEFKNSGGETFGGIGVYGKNGVPELLYMGVGVYPYAPGTGLSITADDMRWKNSKVVTEKWTSIGTVASEDAFQYDTATKKYSEYLFIPTENHNEYTLHYDLIVDMMGNSNEIDIPYNINENSSFSVKVQKNGSIFVYNYSLQSIKIYAR